MAEQIKHRLKAVTPLGGQDPQVETFTGLTIRETTDHALASLALRRAQEKPGHIAAGAYLGAALPEPGRWSGAGVFSAWWMGPDLWMVSAPYASHALLAGALKQAVGDAASVVEQTDGWCRFDLDGARCTDVLERLCCIDLRAGRPGDATRTVMEHLGVFLLCHAPGERYSVLGPRSSAGSLHHALVAAARSVI